MRRPAFLLTLSLLTVGCGTTIYQVAPQSQASAPAAAPAPPPGFPPEPGMPNLTDAEARTLLAVDDHVAPYAPMVPPMMVAPGTPLKGIYRLLVSPSGEVTRVSPLKSADFVVDDGWMRSLRTWKFRPYLVGGAASQFAADITVAVTAE